MFTANLIHVSFQYECKVYTKEKHLFMFEHPSHVSSETLQNAMDTLHGGFHSSFVYLEHLRDYLSGIGKGKNGGPLQHALFG